MFAIRVAHEDQVLSANTDGNTVFTAAGDLSLEDVELLPPCLPTKIVCVGFNYLDHAKELQADVPSEPLLFLKPPSSVIASGQEITPVEGCTQLDYEGELAVVFGTRAKAVTEADAMEHVRGFTILNDVTARNFQRSDKLWFRAKGFDTAAPLGPWIAERDQLDHRDIRVKTYLNGELRQDSSTRDLLFDIPYLIAYASRIMTFEPGDILATGTPPGVGSMVSGDEVTVEIAGIGTLSNRVAGGRTAGSATA